MCSLADFVVLGSFIGTLVLGLGDRLTTTTVVSGRSTVSWVTRVALGPWTNSEVLLALAVTLVVSEAGCLLTLTDLLLTVVVLPLVSCSASAAVNEELEPWRALLRTRLIQHNQIMIAWHWKLNQPVTNQWSSCGSNYY